MFNVPFAQKQSSIVRRSPVFYGWVVWLVATIGVIGTAPGQSFTISLFVDKFIVEFGLDRTTVSGLYGLGTFIAGLSLTWVGRQIDQVGNRRAAVVICVLFMLALFGMSLITGPLGLLVGFMLIRGLGQGSLGLANSTAIAQWFRSRRGQMMSLTVVAFALFQVIYVPWLQALLEVHDWRQVWLMLGGGVGVLVLPVIWLLMRDRPEDFGLRPDGKRLSAAQAEAEDAALLLEDNWTLSEAFRTAIFRVFSLARVLVPAWGTGLVFHQVSIFQGMGHDASIAAQTFSLFAVCAAGMSLLFGQLVDRMRPGVVLALELAALIVALVMAMMMTESWMLWIYALALGMAVGSGAVFDGAVWVNLFGRQNQGAIRGFVATVLVGGTALGPVLFGLSYDHLGSYDAAFWLGIILCAILGVFSLLVKSPQHRSQSG
jgi:sugar phosphate permease